VVGPLALLASRDDPRSVKGSRAGAGRSEPRSSALNSGQLPRFTALKMTHADHGNQLSCKPEQGNSTRKGLMIDLPNCWSTVIN
jgi:hypothetical protein